MAATGDVFKEASDKKEYDKPWVFSYNVLPRDIDELILINESAHWDTKVDGLVPLLIPSV